MTEAAPDAAPLPAPPRRIVVGAGAHDRIIAWLRERRPDLEWRGAPHTAVTPDDLTWAECYVGFKRPPGATHMGGVRWVHCTGAGVDAWLDAPALDARVLLTRTPESFGPPIAEWALARILAFQQRLQEQEAAQRARSWSTVEPLRLAGTRALVVGTGDVGTAVARALAGLGVRVIGVSRSGAPRKGHGASAPFSTIHAVSTLPSLVSDVDFIVLALPATPDTQGLFSRALLARCQGALLLNAGRGAVLDEAALPEALDAGWIRGAALDVFTTEPLPAASPLWAHPRVMISPHNSGPTTVEGAGEGFLECLAALEAGRAPAWVVDRARGY